MPYKDPERKRQWEREHRKERNARRRTNPRTLSDERYRIETSSPDASKNQEPQNVSMIAGLVMGIPFLLSVLFAAWRLRNPPDPVGK